MKRNCLLVTFFAMLACAWSAGSHVRAADRFPWFAPPLPWALGGYRSPASLYSLGRDFVPPYFAIHPPVYYSLPVRRPYGDSPFPRLPDASAPPPPPQMIVNPTIKPSWEWAPTAGADKAAGGPQLIQNPYCRTPESDFASPLAQSAERVAVTNHQ
jgi:hypothetical protein